MACAFLIVLPVCLSLGLLTGLMLGGGGSDRHPLDDYLSLAGGRKTPGRRKPKSK